MAAGDAEHPPAAGLQDGPRDADHTGRGDREVKGAVDSRRGPAEGVQEHEPSLPELLGGRSGAVDASLPALGFAAGWLAGGQELYPAIATAVGTAVAVSAWRLLRRRQPRAAVLGLTGVLVGSLVAARTGRAEDFFLVQLLSNVVSALLWTASIWLRRPLLGLVVATVLRQGKAWRRDPVLRGAYARASWWWVSTYVLRTVVFSTLWASGAVVALSLARVLLSWPLVAACVALSWATLRRRLTAAGHPGLRHPQPAGAHADDVGGRSGQ